MNKELLAALAEHLNRPPWVISADAVVKWGLSDDLDEAYMVGRVWNLLKEWKHAEDSLHLTANRSLCKDYMKMLGFPSFDTYQENAAFILVAVYGDDE